MRKLDGDDSVLDGVLHQIGIGFQLQKFHYGILMCPTVRLVICRTEATSFMERPSARS